MSERKWTAPQWEAITLHGGSLLVSAAAGSGKTAVLVERAIRLICDEANPVAADRLLVVTFSNAAASEMRQRMNARLSAMISQDPANVYLQRQQTLLQNAQISTIHAFCLELIRRNFQHLDIAPDFILADEREMEILYQECAQACIEAFYEREDSFVFSQLVELLTNGRDDKGLIDTILKIYTFSRSHPFYQDWLDAKLSLYSSGLPVDQTVWGDTILRYAKASLSHCKSNLQAALRIIEGEEKLEQAYRPALVSDLAQVEECLATIAEGNWDGAVELLSGFTFQRLGTVRGEDPRKERAKGLRDSVKKTVSDLGEKFLNATADDFREDLADLAPKVELLFDLVRAFDETLWQAKSAAKRLDFSDLEHLALRLLVEKDGGDFVRTQRAQEIAERYETVMVDEYQDSNEVQDLIFTSVSRMQRNLFMVGDVKQSIYSFRQAMPEIFLAKKERFFPSSSGLFPAKIILDTNFRSRDTVTDAVNFLFSRLMSREIGEMDYTDEERLACGAQYPQADQLEPELLLVRPGADKDQAVLAEPDAVAARIRELLDGNLAVHDGAGGLRPATPGDVCILLRSYKSRAESYVQALRRQGIPASAETSSGYLKAREVAGVVSLLRALDNPLLDVELAGALLSPIFGFTSDDLARIRLCRRGVPFYTALCTAAEEGDLAAAHFWELFERLRVEAAVLPADRLLLSLYAQTDALAVVRSMPMGQTRAANLNLLVEYASTYHSLGYKRLGGFVGFLNRLEERDGDLAPATAAADLAGSVQILSIHKSKGLEFPIVVLADTFKQFNKMDLRATTLLHSSYGFACVRRDEKSMRQFSTIPMQAIRLESERSLLSEELRILYVALTRAKEKLILSGLCPSNFEKRLAGLYIELEDRRLPAQSVREAKCYADWLLMSLLHHPDGAPLRELCGLTEQVAAESQGKWKISVIDQAHVQDAVAAEYEFRTAVADPELLQLLQERCAYCYPFQSQTQIPAKLAVSTVAKGEQDLAYRFSRRPKFLSAQKLTGAEKGNALHQFMQFSDYAAARDNLALEIERMERDGFLTSLETASLSQAKLRKFFSSKLADRIFSSEKVLRELKFMAECGKDMLGDMIDGMDDDGKIVLQGVADCVFFENGEAVIVDYKTDVVADAQELLARYARQLILYRRILSESLEADIKQCLLYSFHLGQTIEVR